MNTNPLARLSPLLLLSGLLLAAPAQGQSEEKPRDRERPELIRRGDARSARTGLREELRIRDDRRDGADDRWEDRRDDERRDDERWDDDDRRDDDEGRRGRGKASRRGDVPRGWCQGVGNPHNTLRNCGYSGDSRGGSGSYSEAHDEFHRRHDQQCRIRAAERPLDLQWQLRVRQECRERHDDWHDRMGRRHD